MLDEQQRAVLGTVTPREGFAYFAGFDGPGNFPTLYRVSGKKFIVVGKGTREEYGTAEEAIEVWRSLL